MSGRAAAWHEARSVLAVRLDAMGDVLMTGPALRALKEAVPGRRVTLLASPAGAEAAALLPGVDDVITFEAPWMKVDAARVGGVLTRAMAQILRDGRFDAAVVFTVYSQSPLPAAMLLHLADIPLRAAHCRENPYHLLTDWIPETEPATEARHEVRRQLDLARRLGAETRDDAMRIDVPATAHDEAQRVLTRAGLGGRGPWLLIHPGASAPSRRYPPERFARVAEALARDHGFRVGFTGSAAEVPLVDEIRGAMAVPSASLAGRLSLPALAAAIATAPVLVANNSGPVHVASAVGTPVVDLYALTNPQHTPWRVPSVVLSHDVPCRHCHKSVCPQGHNDCLRLIPPEDVVRAAVALARVERVHPKPPPWPAAVSEATSWPS